MLWSVQKLFYRIWHALYALMVPLLPFRAPKLLTGPGCVRQLPALLKSAKLSRPLIVTGPNIRRRGLTDGLVSALEKAGIPFSVFDRVPNDPDTASVEEAVSAYLAHGADCIIAFGGGSPMDCAKACGARLARPGKSVSALSGMLRVQRALPPLLAVPTTAGTGSEVTIAAVITDKEAHHKRVIADFPLIPRYALLDPTLTASLPPDGTAACGMDALTHAVEAYTNVLSHKSADRDAEQAVALIFQNLKRAYGDGTDMTARENMLTASFLAGRAFTRSGVGNVHAAAHVIGSFCHVSHGLACAVLLPIVLSNYGKAVHAPLARLSKLIGLPGDTDAARADAFIRAILDLNRALGIPETLPPADENDLPAMADIAAREANPFYPVPVLLRAQDFARLIRQAGGARENA